MGGLPFDREDPWVTPEPVTPVRALELERRQSRVPWIYTVYHADPDGPDACASRGAARERRARLPIRSAGGERPGHPAERPARTRRPAPSSRHPRPPQPSSAADPASDGAERT